MAKHSVKARMKSPWWVRKGIYVGVSIIGMVLAAFGWASPETVEQWTSQIIPVVSMILAGFGGMAAVNTDEDSDHPRPLVDAGEVIDALTDVAERAAQGGVVNLEGLGLPIYHGPLSSS